MFLFYDETVEIVMDMKDIRDIKEFVDLVPVGVGANNYDLDFTKIFANKSYYDLLGFTEEEFLERFPLGGLDAFHPEDREEVRSLAIRELGSSGFVCARTRVVHKEKGYIWVQYSARLVCSDGERPKVFVSVVDISDVIASSEALEKTIASLNLIEESLRTEREINNFAVETKYDLVSLVDVKSRELIVYKKGEAFLEGGLDSRGDYDTAARFVRDNLVHVDDREAFERLFFDSLIEEVDSKGKLVLEYRLFDVRSKSYRWKRVLYRYFMNSTDMLIQLTEDINKQFLKMEELLQKAKVDQLTNLYNKATTELIIKEFLEDKGSKELRGALFIIDIDNFKSVNDRLGHIYGDIALSELAGLLRGVFGLEHVVGRVGGDEFFVFVKGFCDLDFVRGKALEVCDLFRRSYCNDVCCVEISASVGIALFPEHGQVFDVLYRSADFALYGAKADGKDCFRFFDGSNVSFYESCRTQIETFDDVHKSLGENRIEFVFRMLFESDGRGSNLESVLRLISEHFGFDRVLVHLFDLCESFSWCEAEGICYGSDFLRGDTDYFGDEVFKFLVDRLNDNKNLFVLRCDDMPSGVRSLEAFRGVDFVACFPLFDGEDFLGNMAFYSYGKGREVLSGRDLEDMNTICGILSTFLVRKYNFDRVTQCKNSVETILDSMEGYVCVVDRAFYRVLYENNSVRGLVGKDSVGKVCYESYMSRDTPCEVCPLNGLGEDKAFDTVEIFSEKLGTYLRSKGSLIKWTDGKEAGMINSAKVTK